jgi:hypothetical protein
MRLTRALLLTLPLLACTSHEGPPATGPAPAAPPAAPDPALADITVAISSVVLEQDCPDPPEAEADIDVDAEREQKARRAGCTQSTMQLALTNPGKAPVTLQIDAVRLLDSSDQQPVASITGRKPSLWDPSGRYTPWDQHLAPGASLQVAYRLSEPTWSKGQADANRLAYSGLLLEVDVRIAGQLRTVRSQEFRRRQDDMVET